MHKRQPFGRTSASASAEGSTEPSARAQAEGSAEALTRLAAVWLRQKMQEMTRPLAELLGSVKQMVRLGANTCVWVLRNSKGHLLMFAQGSPYEGLGFLLDGEWCIQLALGLFKVSGAPPWVRFRLRLRKSCANEGYAPELARYRHVHVRIALKAETAEGFQERAGARGQFWELPFLAISRLLEARVSFHVAAMTDPRLMPAVERRSLLSRLRETGYQGYLEEEICSPYRTSLVRLKEAGYEAFWRKVA